MASQSTSTPAFAEGQSFTRPPLFDGSNFGYWKLRMKQLIMATDMDSWIAIQDGVSLPTSERASEWTENEVKLVKSNAKAMNSLFCALTAAEYDRVSSCITSKEIWDTLTSIYEGTSQV